MDTEMGILKISPHAPKTLIWWYKNRDLIDFDPPYQRRGRLWSGKDKAFLIDTILNGYDIPKLYLADFQFGQSSLNFCKLPYAIIDGKQRLEAIFDFFENKLTLANDFKLRSDPSLELGGLSLKDLQNRYPRVADRFENESLDIMSVFADDEEDIHDIFVRLNRSKPLTGAEIRNAMSGPVPDLVRTLASHDFFVENIRFSVKRAADLNAAAKLLLFEFSKRPVATKKIDLDQFAKRNQGTEALELASRRVIDTLDALQEVFIPKDPLLSSAGVVPVYYWFAKQVDPEVLDGVREFLVWFDNQRSENRQRQKLDSADRNIDPDLSRFDTLNRSTNDEQSHLGRVEILERFFDQWLNLEVD